MMSPCQLQALGKLSGHLDYEALDLTSWSDLLILQMCNLADPNYGAPVMRCWHSLVHDHISRRHALLRHVMQSIGSLCFLLDCPWKSSAVLMKCDVLEKALIKLEVFWDEQCEDVEGECWGVDSDLMYLEMDNLQEVRMGLAQLSTSCRVGFVVQQRAPPCKHEFLCSQIIGFLEGGVSLVGRNLQPAKALPASFLVEKQYLVSDMPLTQQQQAMSSADVIDTVAHVDPAAKIPPVEAAEIVRIQEADFVQMNLGSGAWIEPEERVMLIQLNRTSADLADALTEGAAMEPIRSEMQSNNCPFRLPDTGTFIFVRPWQYRPACEAAFALHPQSLKSSHVIFVESVEHLLEEVIDGIKGKGVWAKYREHLVMDFKSEIMSSVPADAAMDESAGVDSDQASDGPAELIVKNTFLCWVSKSSPQAHSGAHTA